MGAPVANQEDQPLSTTHPASNQLRLHISPFDPSLLSSVIQPSLRSQASQISFHTVQTFPERNYGYVDLPVAEAQKLRSKLNGSILKGVKLRVEVARPPRVSTGTQSTQKDPNNQARSRLHVTSRSQDDQVIPGLLLGNNRRVRRGWTGPRHLAHRSSKEGPLQGLKSSDRTAAHCIFRARAPLNVISNLQPTTKAAVAMGKRRVRQASDQDVVVQEFASTVKFSNFLREENPNPQKKPVSQYVDGQGWVDEDGKVIEPVSTSSRRGRHLPGLQESTPTKGGSENVQQDVQSDSEQTSQDDLNVQDETSEPIHVRESRPKPSKKSKRRATASAEEGSEAEPRPISAQRAAPSLSITIPTDASPTKAAETAQGRPVHPLESIFKKPGKRLNISETLKTTIEAAEAPFSFFEPSMPDDPVVPGLQVPPTPFTQQEFRVRGIRSAAPTPDTAAPGKRFSFDWRKDDEDDEPDADEEDHATTGMNEAEQVILGDQERDRQDAMEEGEDANGEGDVTAPKGFEELFWEQRAHTNRVWRRRRRETGKVRRRMENKRFARRGQL